MVKRPSQKEDNAVRVYLTDDDNLKFLKRMTDSGFTSRSGYLRKLVIEDFKKQ